MAKRKGRGRKPEPSKAGRSVAPRLWVFVGGSQGRVELQKERHKGAAFFDVKKFLKVFDGPGLPVGLNWEKNGILIELFRVIFLVMFRADVDVVFLSGGDTEEKRKHLVDIAKRCGRKAVAVVFEESFVGGASEVNMEEEGFSAVMYPQEKPETFEVETSP